MYSWTEHDSELELTIEDDTLEGLFVEALVAFGDLLTEERGGEPLEHRVDVDADAPAALLAGWLSELIRLAESDRFVPERVVEIAVDERSVRALVFGQRLEPRRRPRGVSERRLEVIRTEPGWVGRVVLDR